MHNEEIELNFDASFQQILRSELEILWEARSTPTLVITTFKQIFGISNTFFGISNTNMQICISKTFIGISNTNLKIGISIPIVI
jgi:hypothetical protein